MILNRLMIGAGLAITAIFYIWLQSGWIQDLEKENKNLSKELDNCSERVKNILEDAEDDATVDNPSDFDVPPSWMRP